MSYRVIQTAFLVLLIAAAVLVFNDRVLRPIVNGLNTASNAIGR
jgi:hypothetical protein